MTGAARAWRSFLCVPIVLIASMVLIAPTRAWNGRGHMLVAFIAYQHLTPQAKATVQTLLELNPHFDTFVDDVPQNASEDRFRTTAFIQSATWPDFIRNKDGYISDGANGGNKPPNTPAASQSIGYDDHFRHKYWHFINVPFSDDGSSTVNPPSVNAQTQIEILRTALGAAGTSNNVKSYDLVWLAHLVGDVHQPLHTVSRFTHSDTNGDTGGNDVDVTCPQGLSCQETLHLEWDHLLGEGTSFNGLKSAATSIDTGPQPAGVNNTNVSAWIQESVPLAKSHVYKTTSGGRLGSPIATLTQGYVNRAKDDARVRIRLAGLRLAKLINDAIGT